MNLQCHGQVEILLLGLWDPSSGNLFAEEGDQQRFWKITRKFIEQMAIASGPGRIKAVRWSATGSHLPLDYLPALRSVHLIKNSMDSIAALS